MIFVFNKEKSFSYNTNSLLVLLNLQSYAALNEMSSSSLQVFYSLQNFIVFSCYNFI
jgi:hypothetical protein